MTQSDQPRRPNPDHEKARALVAVAKRRHLSEFLRDPNVLGAAYGRRIAQDEVTDVPALVIYVMRKVPADFIPPSRHLPRRIYIGSDHIEVDVFETGPIYPLAFTARERPAPSGISIGHVNITAGTLGCLVTDNTDQAQCILSNNHVLADQNAANIGDDIVQPGPADGGSAPDDTIAQLRRFVNIDPQPATNRVDGAIAEVNDPNDVVDQMRGDLMPVPSPEHPAVGLLFAGSCNSTIMNPINDVLTQLNIAFPAGAGSAAAPEIGMNVEKVGRTTEYTTSTIREIDATVTVAYDFGNATFDAQFRTAWMSEGGDSGSVVCRGGAGGNEDHCGCGTAAAASELLDLDLRREEAEAKQVRDKFIRHTRAGRYLIGVFARNEERLLARRRSTEIADEDRTFARELFDRYAEVARRAFFGPRAGEQRIEPEHLEAAEQALERAKKYMQDDEREAADRALALARRAEGRRVREALNMLNDPEIFREVRSLVQSVRFLETPDDERRR